MKIDNSMKFFVGDTAATKILLGSTLVWPLSSSLVKNNEITYITRYGGTATPYRADGFGANIVSNEYKDGIGVITFDGDVTTIGDAAFYGHGSTNDWNYLLSITIPNSVTSIEDSAFMYCELLKSFTIPDSVTTIGKSVFSNCTSLTSVTIGNSVTTIGNYAFHLCSSLTSVTIPDSVTTIGEAAFWSCGSLTSVTIGNNVTMIGIRAFMYCRSLITVYCKATTPPTEGYHMFDDTSPDLVIYVPVSSVDAYKNAEYWSDYADRIVGYEFNQ